MMVVPILFALTRINNAGTNAYRYGPLAESDDEELEEIVTTNVLGVMLCCREVGLPLGGTLWSFDCHSRIRTAVCASVGKRKKA